MITAILNCVTHLEQCETDFFIENLHKNLVISEIVFSSFENDFFFVAAHMMLLSI